MDELRPDRAGPYKRLMTARYAIDVSKIMRELGWLPRQAFEIRLRATVEWYLANDELLSDVTTRRYRGERLGVGTGAT
jgi:dTDP-glucose 4,6-dehydratase